MAGISAGGYERTDAQSRPVVVVGLALFGLFAAGLATAALVTHLFLSQMEGERAIPSPIFERRVPDRAPLLTDEPAYAREAVVEPKRRLSTYGWIHRPLGIVHIPIERAMELYVTRTATTSGGRP